MAHGLSESLMTTHDRADLVLAFAGVLYVNGQATQQMVDAAERLSSALELPASIIPRWGELQFITKSEDGPLAVRASADPSGVQMVRVASTMRAIGDIVSGHIALDIAKKTIDEISQLLPAPTWLFTLAAAAGAV